MVTQRQSTSNRAAARALAPFLAEYRAETGIDLVDRIGDCTVLRLALVHSELSKLIDESTAVAAITSERPPADEYAAEARFLSGRINELLHVTAGEIRHRLHLLAHLAAPQDTEQPRR